jgi:hypothetical protein
MIEIRPGKMTPAEQEQRHGEFLEEIAQRRAQFPNVKADLLASLAPHDAFDLLAALQISFARQWPKGKAPPLHGVPAAAEVLALLLVQRGSRAPTAGGGNEPDFVAALERFGVFAHALLTLIPDVVVPSPPPDRADPGASLAKIRNRMVTRYLLSPLNETDAQADASMLELFSDDAVREHLQREFEGDAAAALRLTDAVADMTAKGFWEAIEVSRTSRSWSGHGRYLSFTVADLAEAAGTDLGQASRYAERFALALDGSDFGFGELTTRARRQPLLRDGERLMPVSVPVLRRALRASLTALLNPRLPAAGAGDKRAFSVYTAERGVWLERKAVATLAGALRPDWAELNVHFSLPGDRRGELDGLLKIGDTLLLVQAKAGMTRIDTEATDPDRFRQTLVDLLGGANLRQHRDAVEALTAAAARLSRDAAGAKPFRRDLSAIRRVLPLHVTLDDLAGIGSQPWLLADAGLSKDRDLPWIVGIGHLELLLEFFELPALFLHFLVRRRRANLTGQLLAHDEVDWAIRYGEDQLLWADLPPDHPYVQREFAVLEEHDAFDRWVLARNAGERGKRPRPSIPSSLRKMLRALDRARPPGWLGFCLSLLDLPEEMRIEVVKLWQRQLRSDQRGESLPLSVAFGAGEVPERGFSVLREGSERHPEGERVLSEFCQRKLASTGARQWSGVVAPFDPSGNVPWCCHLEARPTP